MHTHTLELEGDVQEKSERNQVCRIQNMVEKKRNPVRSPMLVSSLSIRNQSRPERMAMADTCMRCVQLRMSCRCCLNVRTAITHVCEKNEV
jgi:hypothetical protein